MSTRKRYKGTLIPIGVTLWETCIRTLAYCWAPAILFVMMLIYDKTSAIFVASAIMLLLSLSFVAWMQGTKQYQHLKVKRLVDEGRAVMCANFEEISSDIARGNAISGEYTAHTKRVVCRYIDGKGTKHEWTSDEYDAEYEIVDKLIKVYVNLSEPKEGYYVAVFDSLQLKQE